MNARSQVLDLKVDGRQVDEAVASLFHTVLFYRTLGKYDFTQGGVNSVGMIGTTDVDCDFIDLTYVCCTSEPLDRIVKHEISLFSEQLRGSESCGRGEISLEFYHKKKNRWPFAADCIPWEVWTVRLELVHLRTVADRQRYREALGEMMSEKIFFINEVMNRHDYLPVVPSLSQMDTIFDTSFPDIQPYLFKFKFNTITAPGSGTVSNAVTKMLKEML